MRAAKPSVHSPSAELDDFVTRALHELKTSIGRMRMYAALLETQLADEPGIVTLREMVQDVRGQADLVAGIVDDVLN